MVWGITYASSVYGVANVIKYYGFPWIEVSHWCKHCQISEYKLIWFTVQYAVIMITYLHHTDPTLPHYRGNEWNFQRGAAATIDRNFLGWQGRFFLHDVAHYHVIHHVSYFLFFPQRNPFQRSTRLIFIYLFGFTRKKFFPKMPFCKFFFFYNLYYSSPPCVFSLIFRCGS